MHDFGVKELGEGQGEFGFEAGDAEGSIIKLDLFFEVAVGSVVAGDDVNGAISDAFEDGLSIMGGAEGRIHFEAGIVTGPGGWIFTVLRVAPEVLSIGFPIMIAAGDSGVCKGEMVWACLGTNGQALFLGFAQEADGFGAAQVLEMDMGAGFFRKQDVTGNDGLFARGWPAAKSEESAPVTFVHDSVSHEGVILAVIEDGELKHAGVFQGSPHQFIVLDAMSIVGDGDDPGVFERADGCHFLAGEAFGDGPGHKHINRGFIFGFVAYKSHRARLIDRGGGIGHAKDRTETAACGRAGSRGDSLLGRLARFTQVNMEIDQSRADDEAVGFDPLGVSRGLESSVPADGGNFSIVNQEIGFCIELVGGVDDTAAGQEHRIHAEQSISGSALTWQAS